MRSRPISGESYEHRRQWVQNRLLELTRIFAIEVCSFAVMSNHIHVVLSVDTEACASWSMQDVLLRWKIKQDIYGRFLFVKQIYPKKQQEKPRHPPILLSKEINQDTQSMSCQS